VFGGIALYLWGPNSKDRYMTTDFNLKLTDVTGEFYVESIWDLVEEKSCRYVVIKPQYVTDQGEVMKITEIGEEAFKNLDVMQTVYIPLTVEKIDKNAFSGCTGLRVVNFQGTASQWNNIVVENGNEVLKNAEVNYQIDVPDID
jgi:hypothetical protein